MRPIVLVAVLAMTSLSAPAPARGETGEPSIDCQSLEAVRSSIDELAATLREQIAAQSKRDELQLAIAYLQFRSRRIESLEQELRRLEERRASVEGQIERMQGEVEAGEQRMQDAPPEQSEGWRRQMARLQRLVEAEEEEVDRLELRIIDLENEILEGRRQLTTFEDFVLENLRLGE
jgi:chromosome segregation ATPase